MRMDAVAEGLEFGAQLSDAGFVRAAGEPTNTSRPMRITSPPSSVAGSLNRRTGRKAEIAAARLSLSGDGWPRPSA